MITEQVAARGLTDPLVLEALRRVPRHRFAREEDARDVYRDRALPIGFGQTITQPYVVALMTHALGIGPTSRVLEVGTGSGYQAAVLAEITSEVYSIEIVPELAHRAQRLFTDLGYRHLRTRIGDGSHGWADEGPYDAILVTAAPTCVPRPLFDQLAPGGKMCVPVGPHFGKQELLIVEHSLNGTMRTRELSTVRFVPMTGEAATY